jgi:F420-non-reducing hydrogenase small subunit
MYIIQSGAVEVFRHSEGEKIHLNFLEKDDFFGEMALVDNKPRSATVVTICRTRLLPISKTLFTEHAIWDWDTVLFLIRAVCKRIDRLTQKLRIKVARNPSLQKTIRSSPVESSNECIVDDMATVLQIGENQSSQFSKGDSSATLFDWIDGDEISSDPELIQLDAGEIIFEFGDTGDKMYFVVEGNLEVYLQDGDTYCRIALLGRGDFAGEMALFTGARRSASVRAVIPALVRAIDRDDMLAKVRTDPEARRFFLKVLIHRLREATDALEHPDKYADKVRTIITPIVKKSEKLRLGISSLSSCGGCPALFARNLTDVSQIIDNVEIAYCPMLMDEQRIRPVELALVDGAVRTREDERQLCEIRAKCRFLVAWGTCAVFGGIPAIANRFEIEDLLAESYGQSLDPISYYLTDQNGEVQGVLPPLEQNLLRKLRNISDVVRVEYCIPGCPPPMDILKNLIQEMRGTAPEKPARKIVCAECSRKPTRNSPVHFRLFPSAEANISQCLLSQGTLCMGFLTRGGCNAVCPSGGLSCWGCRGPSNNVLKKIHSGESFEEIIRASIARRMKQPDKEIKIPIKILRLKGGSSLGIEQHFVNDQSRIR